MDQEWFTFETAGTLIVGWEGGPLHHKHASCHETSDKKKDSTKFSAISERDESSDSSDDEHHTIATGGKSLKKDYTDALDLAGYERPKTTATGIEIAAALATGKAKKKICVFTVCRPTLFYSCRPYHFFSEKKHKKTRPFSGPASAVPDFSTGIQIFH